MAKPPPPNDECYYVEDTYAVNETMVTTTVRVIMSEMETTNTTTTLTGVTMLIEMTRMGPMSLLKIVKLLLGMVEIVWRELRICCTK